MFCGFAHVGCLVFGFCGLLSGEFEFWWWVFGDCLVGIWPVDLRDLFMIWVW